MLMFTTQSQLLFTLSAWLTSSSSSPSSPSSSSSSDLIKTFEARLLAVYSSSYLSNSSFIFSSLPRQTSSLSSDGEDDDNGEKDDEDDDDGDNDDDDFQSQAIYDHPPLLRGGGR